MKKKTISWENPEIRASADEKQDFINFVLNKTKLLTDIKPQFICFRGKHKFVEKNGLYIGSTIENVSNFKSGYNRKVSQSWEDISPYQYSSVRIHPGTFSFLMQKSNTSEEFFVIYEKQNSIAMQDVFSVLYKLNLNKDLVNLKKLETVLKTMFNASKKSFKNYEKAKSAIDEVMKELESIQIGSDPEFSIVEKNNHKKLVNAFQIVKSKADFKIGADGHDSILELRPGPSNDIDSFLKELDSTMLETSELVDEEEFDLLSGGGEFRNESLGGHIHFSNIAPTPEFLEVLDEFIGAPLMGCPGGVRAENDRDNYNRLSNYRNQEYDNGRIKGFEYRTPPSFFGNEKLAKAVYTIAMLLAKTYAFHQKMNKPFEYTCGLVKSNYKMLINYEKYKEQIDYFYEHVSNKLPINGYVFANWKIKDKKDKESININIKSNGDIHLKEIIPTSMKVYKPPFKELIFYGISEKVTPLYAITIDSTYINRNVNTGYLHRWLRDSIKDICILDRDIKQSNIENFINNGSLYIGLSMPLREFLLKIDEVNRHKLIKKFIKRLAVYVRHSLKDTQLLDKNDKNEVAEYEIIKSLTN